MMFNPIPKIITSQVNKVLGSELNLFEILQLGASKLLQMSKQLKNEFWKQVFSSVIDIFDGAAFSYPEKLLSSPFFHNNLILRNNKAVKESNYPELKGKISSISDFFIPETTQIMQWADFCERRACNISEQKYIDIRYVINLAIQKLKIPQARLLPACYPQKPLLIDLALLTNKGCRPYYLLLQTKNILKNRIYKRENKWHEELGCLFSINFWNSTRKLCKEIFLDNKLKWLQFQIIRNSLQTNFIVSHFKANVTNKCQYCLEWDELISHLFGTCRIVKTFFDQLIVYFSGLNIDFAANKVQILFGFQDKDITHPKNLFLLIFKRYVWITKFRDCNLNIIGFKSLFKTYVVDLKYILSIKKEHDKFEEWNTIDNALNQH